MYLMCSLTSGLGIFANCLVYLVVWVFRPADHNQLSVS